MSIEEIIEKLLDEGRKDIVEALILNEKLRRRAPKGWDSTEIIKKWRNMR